MMADVYANVKLELHTSENDQAALTAVTDLTSMEHEFIKRYEQLPLLWKKDHTDYSNKYKRNLAYDLLLPILRTFSPTANRYNVRQKINILRSSYRKELRKYYASKIITENGDIIFTHNPPSWKFTAMKFLQEWSSSDMSEIVIEETVEEDSINDMENQELVFIQEPEVESANEEQDIPENPISTGVFIQKEMKPIVIKNPRKRNSYNDSIMIDRECTAVGSNVTCKLQRMNNEQRNYAEQLINKVLMRGLKRTLSDDTDFTDDILYSTKIES